MSSNASSSKLKAAAVHSAEQWVIECRKCGHAAPALERGIFRAWASSHEKRVLARCTNCGKLTLSKLTKDPERACELRINTLDQQLDQLAQTESSAPPPGATA